MKNKILIGIIVSAIVILMGYASLGIFVIQPIGAIPGGASILYLRIGTSLPFISSADGFLLKTTGSVNLFARALVMAKLSEPVLANKITTLPYSKVLYLYSTNGVEFEK